MMKQIFRSRKNSDEWCTEDGLELGKGDYDKGDILLKHPVTGEQIRATIGVMVQGEFFSPCQKQYCGMCQGIETSNGIICRRQIDKEKLGYFADVLDAE